MLESFHNVQFININGLCVSSFSGNLKHKDLQGREVASQLYPEANGDEDEEDEEQEEEEHDSDETVDENVALDAEEL